MKSWIKGKLIRMGFGLFAGALLLAAGPTNSFAELQWDLSLSAGVVYDDNVDLLADESVLEADINERIADDERRREALAELREVSRDDTIYTVSPSISLQWSERDDSLGVAFSTEYRDYGESLRDDEWIHTVDAGLEWRRFQPFRLSVTDIFDVTPRDLVTPEEDLRTQIQHNALTVRPSLYWDVSSRTSFELAYILERDDFYGDNIFEEPEDDTIRHLGEFRVSHKWSPRTENHIRVTGGVAEHDIAEDYDLVEGAIGGLHNISQRTDFSWEAGLQQRWYDIADDDLNFIGEALLAWRHHENGRLELSASGEVDDRFDGERIEAGRVEGAEVWAFPGGASFTAGAYYEHRAYQVEDRTDGVWEPYAEVAYPPTDWLTLFLEGGYRTSQVEEAVSPVEETPEVRGSNDEHLARVRGGVVLLPWRNISVETAYEYRDNRADDPLDEYSQNIVSLELTGTFSALSR